MFLLENMILKDQHFSYLKIDEWMGNDEFFCWNMPSRREAPRCSPSRRGMLFFYKKSWSEVKQLMFFFFSKRVFSLDFSRKLASASWSLLALASSGAAPRHHVNIH